MSDDEDSCSSRMSVKSEKNMADFEGEECVYEEELVQLAIQAQSQLPHHLASMASMYQVRTLPRAGYNLHPRGWVCIARITPHDFSEFISRIFELRAYGFGIFVKLIRWAYY